MNTRSVSFTGRREACVVDRELPPPDTGEVTVRVRCSAISAGTELLFYRGLIPEGAVTDTSLTSLQAAVSYPLVYGYATVGCVETLGKNVSTEWLGRRVFAFEPHTERYTARCETLVPIPDHLSDEDAVFLPNMETALSLVQDTAPLAGERVGVLGLGVVGLLAISLLARYPLRSLCAFDPNPQRRARAASLGATIVATPSDKEAGSSGDLDACIEISGKPAALNAALALTGASGRIVVGSWYADPAELELGVRFHRGRQTILSSQVSEVTPALRGRWDKARRLDTALWLIERTKPAHLITHRLPLDAAEEAYALLDAGADDVLQILFTYDT